MFSVDIYSYEISFVSNKKEEKGGVRTKDSAWRRAGESREDRRSQEGRKWEGRRSEM